MIASVSDCYRFLPPLYTMDQAKTAKVISDIISGMDAQPLQWYKANVTALAQMLQTSYENAHKLVLTMRNQ